LVKLFLAICLTLAIVAGGVAVFFVAGILIATAPIWVVGILVFLVIYAGLKEDKDGV